MLKPMDIHNKEFKRVMRGYDVEEVDEFLDEIIVDFEKMQRELDVLKTQISNYSENMNNYREKELSLNNVMLSAQRFADQLTVDAERKAAEIIATAQGKSREMRKAAQDFVDDIMRRADEGLTANLGEVRKTRAALKQQIPSAPAKSDEQ